MIANSNITFPFTQIDLQARIDTSYFSLSKCLTFIRVSSPCAKGPQPTTLAYWRRDSSLASLKRAFIPVYCEYPHQHGYLDES